MTLSTVDQPGSSVSLLRSRLAVVPGDAPILGDQMQFRFTLPESKLTSAAVYNSSGVKIRNLWGGRRLAAATYVETWDGLNDDGVAVTPGDYTVKLLHHNIEFTFASLFNTFSAPIGKGTIFQHRQPTSIRTGGGDKVFWMCGYTEKTPYTYRFTEANPNIADQHLPYISGFWVGNDAIADSSYLYVAVNRSTVARSADFEWGIIKLAVAAPTLGTWSSLTSDGKVFPISNSSLGNETAGSNFSQNLLIVGSDPTDSTDTNDYVIDAMAVQTTGNIIAVSLPNSNLVKFYHKGTGATIRTSLSVTNPTALAWSADETKLFVANGASSTILTVFADDGTDFDAVHATTSGFQRIVDLATDAVTGYTAAAIAGTTQQVKAYNVGLTLQWTLGQSGGYASTAVVAADRFHFNNVRYGGTVAFQSDGKLWVYDRALMRIQRFTQPHIDATVDKTHHIAFDYHCAVDISNASRLAANHWLGYTRDWTLTNTNTFGGGGAWTLDRFWGYTIVDSYTLTAGGGIKQMCSSGGRLYARAVEAFYDKILELTSTGIREIATTDSVAVYSWDEDFNRYTIPFGGGTISKSTFAGLNGSNNPTWNSPTTLATYSTSSLTDPYPTIGQGMTPLPLLSDGSVVVGYYALDTNLNRYHIGALNSSGYTWKHGRASEHSVPFPKDGTTTTETNAFMASTVAAKDELAVLSVNGEFYNGGQAGQHLIYNKDGMYVASLGHVAGAKPNPQYYYPALGENGNALSANLIYENGKYRYIHALESQLRGLYEYTFDNFDSYEVSAKTGSLGTTVTMDPITSAGGAPNVIGSVVDSDDFERADSNTIGNGWTEVTDKLEIKEGTIRVKDSNYQVLNTAICYRGADVLDSCQKIYIPTGFFLADPYGWYSGGILNTEFAVVARYNTSTGVFIMGTAAYNRFPRSPGVSDYNGTWGVNVYAYDGTKYWYLAGIDARWLPATPGHEYSLRLIVTGTQPTKIEVLLWDETDNVEVMRDYTENYDTVWESAGKCGLSMGFAEQRISAYEKRNFTWPVI